MAKFNFLEEAIIEELTTYIDKYGYQEHDNLLVEVEKDGISYGADIRFSCEVEGYYDNDYYCGTGYYEVTKVDITITDIDLSAYDKDDNELKITLPEICEYEVCEEIANRVA